MTLPPTSTYLSTPSGCSCTKNSCRSTLINLQVFWSLLATPDTSSSQSVFLGQLGITKATVVGLWNISGSPSKQFCQLVQPLVSLQGCSFVLAASLNITDSVTLGGPCSCGPTTGTCWSMPAVLHSSSTQCKMKLHYDDGNRYL